jgi:hypothetical protein
VSIAAEMLRAAEEAGCACHLLATAEASLFISSVIARYRPEKIAGHLAISHDSVAIPLERYELTFSKSLPQQPAYLFFDQSGADKGAVVVLPDGRALCTVLEHAFGIEYFVTNNRQDYLIAVNWYVIEGAGAAVEWMAALRAESAHTG